MTFWNDKRIELLRKYIEVEGYTFAQAASALHCSRNAALAKAHRLKLVQPSADKYANRRNGKTKEKQKSLGTLGTKYIPKKGSSTKPTPPKLPKPRKFRIRLPEHLKGEAAFWKWFNEPKPASFEHDILNIPGNHECKWIHGQVRSRLAVWCRKPVYNKTSWCLEHFRIVYSPRNQELE